MCFVSVPLELFNLNVFKIKTPYVKVMQAGEHTLCHGDSLWCKSLCMHVFPCKPVPVLCSGPLAGAAPLARRRRPAVGAAPDGFPAPAAPGGPGRAAVPARCAPPPARCAAHAARRSAPVASLLRLHAKSPAPGGTKKKSHFSDSCKW